MRTLSWAAGLVLGSLLGGVALAQPAQGDGRAVIVAASWLRQPTQAELRTVFPSSPLAEHGGDARVRCTLTETGVLRDCIVVSESPPEAGFGNALLALTPTMLMRPSTRNGVPFESVVNIPMHWEPYAAPREGGRPLVSPAWVEAPGAADIDAMLSAQMRTQSGRAIIICRMLASGRVTACILTMTEPSRSGFGGVAQRLSRRFRAEPGSWPHGSRASVQINFSFPGAARDELVGVQWITRPTAEALDAAFPPAAREAGLARGQAELLCEVGPQGVLQGCRLQAESSLHGWGEAALGLAGQYRMAAWTPEGRPTIGRSYRLVVRFGPPDAAP